MHSTARFKTYKIVQPQRERERLIWAMKSTYTRYLAVVGKTKLAAFFPGAAELEALFPAPAI